MTTIYNWATDTTTVESNIDVDLLGAVGTSFTVITTVLDVAEKGSQGIKITDGANDLFFVNTPMEGANVITAPEGDNYLAVEWSNTDSVVVPYCSTDGEVWEKCPMPPDENGDPMPYPVFVNPTQAGVFVDTVDPLFTEIVVFGSPRVLTGTTFVLITGPDADPEMPMYAVPSTDEVLEPIGVVPTEPPGALTPSEEAVIHGFVGAPFGDLEFDVGKSVGWFQRFCDDLFVSDVNLGTQRYWVVNWSKTFDYTYYKFSPINYFTDPEEYRQRQVSDAFKYASYWPQQLHYDDNDWVIFLDAHEGLSCDTSSFPDDFLVAPFKSFVYREVARANAAGKDRIVFPFFVYLHHKHIQNVSQSYEFEGQTFTATQSAGVPYYLPHMGLTRMFKVSALKNPAFDWSILDTPVAPDTGVKMQIVSYAYAHWNLNEVPPGETTVPPLDANNDDGWKQRCLISQVLPVPGLPVGSATDPVGTWKDPALFPDPPGLRGPWAFDTYVWRVTDPVIPNPPPAIAPEVAGILTPMYDLVFRLNVRDGVWYEQGGTGPAEVVWDEDLGDFVPYIPAEGVVLVAHRDPL